DRNSGSAAPSLATIRSNPFLRERGPKRLLAIMAPKPSGAVLAVRTCILIDQKEAVTANDTADLAHQAQLVGSREVMERKMKKYESHMCGTQSDIERVV